MTMEHEAVERAIDQAAHQLLTGAPSVGFVTEVLNRIEQSDLVPEERLFWSPWRLATAGAVALAVVLLLLLSRQTVRQPLPVEPSRVARADNAAERSRAESAPAADNVSEPGTAAVTPTPTPRLSVSRRRESEPFPVVPPIEIESITLDPIEMAGIDVALLEISPIRIDPVGITRQETP